MASAAMANLSYTYPIAVAGHISCHPKGIPQSRKLLLPLPLPSGRIINSSGGKNRAVLSVQRLSVAAESSSNAQSQTSVEGATGNEERTRKCLQDLAETLILPPDFLAKLPDGLKVDLNDAAFALSSGPLNQECGETVGALVMGLSRALEQADAQTAAALAAQVPSIQENLPTEPFASAALGKRLQAAGRFLSSTGQYGNGELQKLSKALLEAGEALLLSSPDLEDRPPLTETTRMLKFGDLQVKLTARRAYTGAVIAFVFGVLCWNLTSGLANTGIDPSQYANDSSFSVAYSLRGTLLTAGYACAALSAMSMLGLLALASQLGPEDSS
ncbi:unnamed protein product [Calypogeia fissa]